MYQKMKWTCGNFSWDLSKKSLIMGILNVTPDSFSDGGRYLQTSDAIQQAYELIEHGADIIDVGGESSRPGAEAVSEEEEINRVIPIIEEIAKQAGYAVSIDTVKYNVAKQALDAGACIVNDISGMQQEPRLADLVAAYKAGYVIMHMRGTPQTMQNLTDYDNLLNELKEYFTRQTQLARQHGVKAEQVVLDPGIGFSKDTNQNLQIIKQLHTFKDLGYPLLLGVSRKSFIGKITGKDVTDRIMGTAAAVTACIMHGAHVLRVHDVKAMKEVITVADAIQRQPVNQPEENLNLCG